MRYFAWHELVYQCLIASGATTWDRTPYDEYELRPLVAKVLRQLLRPGERVLVLGCGTGPDACHFAQAGMRVTGIDISPPAIDLAKKQAGDRGLDVTWVVGDACDLNRAGRFDAVLDAHAALPRFGRRPRGLDQICGRRACRWRAFHHRHVDRR